MADDDFNYSEEEQNYYYEEELTLEKKKSSFSEQGAVGSHGNIMNKNVAKILTMEKLEKLQEDFNHNIVDKYGIDTIEAFRVECECNWNELKLEKYFQKFFFDQNSETIEKQEDSACQICYEGLNQDNMMHFSGCQHIFCRECIAGLIENAINSGDVTPRCPQEKCKMIAHRSMFKKYLSEQNYKKYQHLLVQKMVNDPDNMFLCCLRPGCDSYFKIEPSMRTNNSIYNLKCLCEYVRCSGCQLEGHRPIKCSLIKLWTSFSEKGGGLDEAYIRAYTRNCPKCGIPIIRDTGCARIVCGKCHFEFCYLCLGDWQKIGGYKHNCNVYNPQDEEKKDTWKQKEKSLFMKFQFHFDRYMENKKSLEKAMQKQISKKIEYEDFLKLTHSEHQPIFETALELIVECRRALAYTFPYGFFLRCETKLEINRKQFFEFLQHEMQCNLDLLDDETDLNLVDKFTFMQAGNKTFDNEFYRWIFKITKMTKLLKDYFSRMVYQFENDLPETQHSSQEGAKGKDSPVDIFFNPLDIGELDSWYCSGCTSKNSKKLPKCAQCGFSAK